MGWSEKDFCIKCGKGGKVLACSDSCCPISVHENCLRFPAKFDETGNFYCPYCLYRRATEESRQAREKAIARKKALSNFLDMNMLNGDKQAHETARFEGQESTQSQNTGRGNIIDNCDDENGLDKAVALRNSVQLGEKPLEKEFTPGISISVSLRKGIDIGLLGKQNEVYSCNYRDSARLSNCMNRLMAVENEVYSCNDDVCSDEEGTTQQFELVEIRKTIQLEHHKQVDDDQHMKSLETHLEGNHFGDFPEAEKQGTEVDFPNQAKRRGNNANPLEENEGTVSGEEEMEEQLEECNSSFANDPTLVPNLKGKGELETNYTICRDSEAISASKLVKHNDERRGHPIDVHCSRRSSRNSSSALRTDTEETEKDDDTRKFKEVTAFSQNLLPSVRRKKLPWTEHEEDMLKEGVQKFSNAMNKNIPWRKILEFGRHVFHGTRTPVDLKDKWRNILAKER